jgi:hypothetical protein
MKEGLGLGLGLGGWVGVGGWVGGWGLCLHVTAVALPPADHISPADHIQPAGIKYCQMGNAWHMPGTSSWQAGTPSGMGHQPRPAAVHASSCGCLQAPQACAPPGQQRAVIKALRQLKEAGVLLLAEVERGEELLGGGGAAEIGVSAYQCTSKGCSWQK